MSEPNVDVDIFSKILVVDDDPISTTTICYALEENGYVTLLAESGEAALTLAEAEALDLILLDINMPGINGLDVCRRLKEAASTQDIPVIFLTSSNEDAAEAFNVGAVDYVIKPFNVSELIARVNVHAQIANLVNSLAASKKELQEVTDSLEDTVTLRTQELLESNRRLRAEIEEKQLLQEQLERLSKYDVISGLYNRIAMTEHLELKLLESQMLLDHTLYYLSFDVDEIKLINDEFGHTAGDFVLGHMAESVTAYFNYEDDIVARMGGDEFAVIFVAPNFSEAKSKAATLQDKIAQSPLKWEDRNIHIKTSAALVELSESFQDANHIIRCAEKLSYQAKTQGGGKLLTHSEDTTISSEEQDWGSIIKGALAHNQFELFGQGIYPMGKDTPACYEVLLRLNEQDKTLLPHEFVNAAHRNHLMTSIDKWVIEQSLITLDNVFGSTNAPNIALSINVSSDSIRDAEFVRYVKELVSGTRFGNFLCFDIKETTALACIDSTQYFIEQLASLGVTFAIDDFGTGGGNFSSLKDLDFQFIKVDGVVIKHVQDQEISQVRVNSICSQAKDRDIKVIAEEVENEATLHALKGSQLSFLQGYALHEPTPLGSVLKSTLKKPL